MRKVYKILFLSIILVFHIILAISNHNYVLAQDLYIYLESNTLNSKGEVFIKSNNTYEENRYKIRPKLTEPSMLYSTKTKTWISNYKSWELQEYIENISKLKILQPIRKNIFEFEIYDTYSGNIFDSAEMILWNYEEKIAYITKLNTYLKNNKGQNEEDQSNKGLIEEAEITNNSESSVSQPGQSSIGIEANVSENLSAKLANNKALMIFCVFSLITFTTYGFLRSRKNR